MTTFVGRPTLSTTATRWRNSFSCASSLYRLQKAAYGSIAACPAEFAQHQRDVTLVGLELFARQAVEPLQDIAQALLTLGHCELALGYAHAATRIAPSHRPPKAFYYAALACHKLQAHRAASTYLSHVRTCYRPRGCV